MKLDTGYTVTLAHIARSEREAMGLSKHYAWEARVLPSTGADEALSTGYGQTPDAALREVAAEDGFAWRHPTR